VAESVKFEGEEAGAGYAAPHLDLIAAGFLVCLALIVMVASFKLPVPGAILTAPGLLPFLTAASLLLMALFLGATAINRRRNLKEFATTPNDTVNVNVAASDLVTSDIASTDIAPADIAPADKGEQVRTFLLIAVVGVYIASLQLLAFQHNINIGSWHFSVSAFEPVTIITLVVIIQSAWRGPLWITTLLSIIWTLLLSVVFQKAFVIPLPGSF